MPRKTAAVATTTTTATLSCQNSGCTDLPRSIPLLLARRVEGQFHICNNKFGLGGGGTGCSGNPSTFRTSVTRQFAPKTLVQNPLLVTPQSTSSTRNGGINSLHVDRVENRFLLAGGADAIISVYDLSKWGSEEYLDHQQKKNRQCLTKTKTSRSVHKPIASSQREPPRSIFSDPSSTTTAFGVDIPSGHASPVTKVQWYPVDSGAFISSSKDGSLLIWDTDSMSPVAHCTPFDTKGISSFHLSPLRTHSAVVASYHDPSLKLVDIRSGASSHTLLGHASIGVSSVQWAPHCDVIFASGGLDGTVRLWDIRKAGSRSCVAILNQDVTHHFISSSSSSSKASYRADYSHLPKPSAAILSNIDDSSLSYSMTNYVATTTATASSSSLYRHSRKSNNNNDKTKKTRRPFAPTTTITTQHVAPNNYRPSENSSVLSHNGPVLALSFGAAQDGHSLVSAGQDGNLHVWDLRGNGHLLPIRFFAPGGQQPAVSSQQQRKQQIPMLLTSFSRFSSASPSSLPLLGACWIGNGSNLLGYSLERGGTPQQVLQGHLQAVTAMDAVDAAMQVFTAGKDGMILTWGNKSHRRRRGGGDHQNNNNNRKRMADQDSW